MKIRIPAKTVEVCYICHHEGFLENCTVCKRKYCIVHESTVAGSYGFTHVCRNCGQRQDVQDVCQRYAERLTPIFNQRQTALKKLPKSNKPESAKS